MFLGLGACNPDRLVDVDPPSSVVDPSSVITEGGALQLYGGAVQSFWNGQGSNAIGGGVGWILSVGFFTDELMELGAGSYPYTEGVNFYGLDERNLRITTNVLDLLYAVLNAPRVQAQQARQALQLYGTNLSSALVGHMYAIEAYQTIYLAEAFCSGIPLSRVPLVGTPVGTRGFTTQEMLERAVALLDSAIAISADSANIMNLAKVGKGRAYLDLGQFDSAAAAVQGVPLDFVYNAQYGVVNGNYVGFVPNVAQVKDQEGLNGEVWSTDPRTPVGSKTGYGTLPLPGKYTIADGVVDLNARGYGTPIRVADGLEAQLILAEADLANQGSSWLSILNALRSTCVGAAPCAPVPGITAAALPPLTDPGTPDARLDLLMSERAHWLYLTGHRQGDLRRLAHVYQRDPETVWPTGTYINTGDGTVPAARYNGQPYGLDVVLQPPEEEQKYNPQYKGCNDLLP